MAPVVAGYRVRSHSKDVRRNAHGLTPALYQISDKKDGDLYGRR